MEVLKSGNAWVQVLNLENASWEIKYLQATFWTSNTMVTNLSFIPVTNEEILFSQIA